MPRASRRASSITKWNLLALLAAVVGGGATLGLDQLWIQQWSQSGERFPVGRGLTVDLPAGRDLLVYYESEFSVPSANVILSILDPYGRRLRPRPATDDENSFKVALGGWSGRALWRVDVLEPGPHTFSTYNNNYASDAEVPASDRVVFGKTPGTVAEVQRVRKTIQIIGASVTMLVLIAAYVLHAIALTERAAAPPAEATPRRPERPEEAPA